MNGPTAALAALLLLAGCAATPPAQAPETADQARAAFDARCAERPTRASMEQALAAISPPGEIRKVERQDFERELPAQLRQAPPGTRSALRGGGKPYGTRSFLGFGPSYVRAAVFLDAEDRVLGCRADVYIQGP